MGELMFRGVFSGPKTKKAQANALDDASEEDY